MSQPNSQNFQPTLQVMDQAYLQVAALDSQLQGPELPQQQQLPLEHQFRQMTVDDIHSYLDLVKSNFYNHPQVYNEFLEILKGVKAHSIDTSNVIQRVSNLFAGHPDLLLGFNCFLPPGYKIEVMPNRQVIVTIPCTVPGDPATTIQSEDVVSGDPTMTVQSEGVITTIASDLVHPPNSYVMSAASSMPTQCYEMNAYSPSSYHFQPVVFSEQSLPQLATQPLCQQPEAFFSQQPVTIIAQSATQPLPQHTEAGRQNISQHPLTITEQSAIQPLSLQPKTTQRNSSKSKKVRCNSQPVTYKNALRYVQKIKKRFQDQPDMYKQFLEILRIYREDQLGLQKAGAALLPETELYFRVSRLFQNQEDLLQEFGKFYGATTASLVEDTNTQIPSTDSAELSTNQPTETRNSVVKYDGYRSHASSDTDDTELYSLASDYGVISQGNTYLQKLLTDDEEYERLSSPSSDDTDLFNLTLEDCSSIDAIDEEETECEGSPSSNNDLVELHNFCEQITQDDNIHKSRNTPVTALHKSPNSSDTVLHKSPNSPDTVLHKSPDSRVTVLNNSPDSRVTVFNQSPDSPDTVQNKSPDSFDTVQNKSPDSLDTVLQKLPDSFVSPDSPVTVVNNSSDSPVTLLYNLPSSTCDVVSQVDKPNEKFHTNQTEGLHNFPSANRDSVTQNYSEEDIQNWQSLNTNDAVILNVPSVDNTHVAQVHGRKEDSNETDHHTPLGDDCVPVVTVEDSLVVFQKLRSSTSNTNDADLCCLPSDDHRNVVPNSDKTSPSILSSDECNSVVSDGCKSQPSILPSGVCNIIVSNDDKSQASIPPTDDYNSVVINGDKSQPSILTSDECNSVVLNGDKPQPSSLPSDELDSVVSNNDISPPSNTDGTDFNNQASGDPKSVITSSMHDTVNLVSEAHSTSVDDQHNLVSKTSDSVAQVDKSKQGSNTQEDEYISKSQQSDAPSSDTHFYNFLLDNSFDQGDESRKEDQTLYDDLLSNEYFEKRGKVKELQEKYSNELAQSKKLCERKELLSRELCTMKKKNAVLIRNINSLFELSKLELERKNVEIQSLQEQVDLMVFRRHMGRQPKNEVLRNKQNTESPSLLERTILRDCSGSNIKPREVAVLQKLDMDKTFEDSSSGSADLDRLNKYFQVIKPCKRRKIRTPKQSEKTEKNRLDCNEIVNDCSNTLKENRKRSSRSNIEEKNSYSKFEKVCHGQTHDKRRDKTFCRKRKYPLAPSVPQQKRMRGRGKIIL